VNFIDPSGHAKCENNPNNLTSEHLFMQRASEELKQYVSGDTPKWTSKDFIKWFVFKDDEYLNAYENNWIWQYRQIIQFAAGKYDIPAYLLAGVAKIELGGDPEESDRIIYELRKNTPKILKFNAQLKRPKNSTSFGPMSMQISVAAETLGYDYTNLTEEQTEEIITSLNDPIQSLYIAAKHLSHLRDVDYKGIRAGALTEKQVSIIATRYNVGASVKLKSLEGWTQYGEEVINNRELLEGLIYDEIKAK